MFIPLALTISITENFGSLWHNFFIACLNLHLSRSLRSRGQPNLQSGFSGERKSLIQMLVETRVIIPNFGILL